MLKEQGTAPRSGTSTIRIKAACVFNVISLLGGCAGRLDIPAPRDRIGALPFPGLFSLYVAANPNRVAPHQYRAWTQRPFEAEGDRGILFTRRAGFLDVAHVRLAMDWSWYIARVIHRERERSSDSSTRSEVLSDFNVVIGYEGSTMQIRIKADEYSEKHVSALAAAAAYRLLTWHEVATWYGYQTVPFVSERRSTFTVDDSMSHVVGVELGSQLACMTRDRATYDRLAGELLTQKLADLGATDEATTTQMCNAVQGTWWSGVDAFLIDANVGLNDQSKRPLLPVTQSPELYELGAPLPRVDGFGASTSPWYSIRVCGETSNSVRRVLRCDLIESDDDLAMLINDVTRQIAATRSGVTIVTDESVAMIEQEENRVALAQPMSSHWEVTHSNSLSLQRIRGPDAALNFEQRQRAARRD